VALPVPLRRTFTYRVPRFLDPDSIQIGHRVLVPFGARILFGVVWTQARHLESSEHRLRNATSYDPEHKVLSDEIRALLEWMETYYLVPLGDLIKMALPPGMLPDAEPLFELTLEGQESVGSGGTTSKALACLESRPLSRSQWKKAYGTAIKMGQMQEWEAKHLIRPIFPGPVKKATPQITSVALTEKGTKTSLEDMKGARRQAEVLQVLQAHTRELSLDRLRAIVPFAMPVLHRMAQNGLLAMQQRPHHFFEGADESTVNDGHGHTLTDEQAAAFEEISRSLDCGGFSASLVFGVTGSGKTELYLRAVEACLKKGRRAIILVPEIALTPLMKDRVSERLGGRLAILHSAVPKKERAENWSRVLAGKVQVVLGARSGIFAPLPNLGLIIVDEEHDSSYKQGDGPRYHARDLALVRGKQEGATVLLGSATPSLESWSNAEEGRYQLLTLKQRATKASLPDVLVVDMKEEFEAQRKRPVFSRRLIQGIEQRLQVGEQVMLLLNRRGYHRFLLCRRCGQAVECHQCEVTMTYHSSDAQLRCHYCDSHAPAPETCPNCEAQGHFMHFFGEGTQLVQEQLAERFPDARIDRLDRDRLTRKGMLQSILDRFRDGDTDVLIGTQMIAKGHDFHNVTLVGILNADQGLRIPDFRSAENTFQLLTQVAGRSGRGSQSGQVVVQTYMPDHYSIQYAKNHDFESFANRELRFRRHLFYPPLSYLLKILIQGSDYETARQSAQLLIELSSTTQEHAKMHVLGPVKAAIGKIKNRFRFQILVKAASRTQVNQFAREALRHVQNHAGLKAVDVFFDVDPLDFS